MQLLQQSASPDITVPDEGLLCRFSEQKKATCLIKLPSTQVLYPQLVTIVKSILLRYDLWNSLKCGESLITDLFSDPILCFLLNIVYIEWSQSCSVGF